MLYKVENAPIIDTPNGRKWSGIGSKWVVDKSKNSHLSYLFKNENRETYYSSQVFCFYHQGKSLYFDVGQNLINGNWKSHLWGIFGLTDPIFIERQFRDLGGYPSIYPPAVTLNHEEKILMTLLAMLAFIEYGTMGNGPECRKEGIAIFVYQNIDTTGLIPNIPLSQEEIEKIINSRIFEGKKL
ncbi:hypothetical protein [Zavarzinia compransoris]|uniref:hypothetical protein n=1 Tax=Zavarzinia compransoris TaxID=1264899 RepID=UPI00105CEC6A|nr:hypothetical protein [Zavarzinia compransoris]